MPFDTVVGLPLFAQRIQRKRRHTAPTQQYERVQQRVPKQQAVILRALQLNGPATRQDLSERTGLPLASVCGRVNELVKAGAVIEQVHEGRIVTRNGRRVVAAAYHTMSGEGRDQET